ncbi:MAG: glycosyltransferase [Gemmatimonas sp.]
MKILHVIADLDPRHGGPTAACAGLAATMARRGHSVRILTTDRGFSPPAAVPNLAVEAVPGSWPAFFGTSWALQRRLADIVPSVDVVHVHSLYLFHDWAAGRTCRRHRVPYIVRPHGTLDPFLHRRHRWRKAIVEALFQNRMLRGAAGLHYTTTEEWKLAAPFARNARGAIVPNAVDLAEFDRLPPRTALRSRYPAIGDRTVVLFLGRLNFKKGVDTAVAAFAAATRGRDDLFLILAGPDDGMAATAKALIAEFGIGDRVLFTGLVGGEDKRVLLAGSDLFMLPSMSENFGIAVVEAAACGLPVILSDRINLWREFADAGAALVGPPSASFFADAIRRLAGDRAMAMEMGRRGGDLVRRRYAWDAVGDACEAMYAEAIRTGVLPVLP